MVQLLAALAIVVAADPADWASVCELAAAVPATANSRSCVACHDGTVAPMADVSFPDTLEGFEGANHREGTHPVEIDYQAAWLRRPGALTDLLALPRELQLTDGAITCITCHSPGASGRFKLSLPMEGSALCLACHRM